MVFCVKIIVLRGGLTLQGAYVSNTDLFFVRFSKQVWYMNYNSDT